MMKRRVVITGFGVVHSLDYEDLRAASMTNKI